MRQFYCLLLVFFSSLCWSQNTPIFKTGDRICFIGNSITHSGEFHHNIMLYHSTRFPDVQFKIFNCGVSGDKAVSITNRMDSDILVLKPNIAVLMIGMNDVNTVAIGASGSTDGTIMYFANYFRIDKSEIDQEPYIELYENGLTQSSIYGILHHADFIGRTETLDSSQLLRISASGSTTDIQFTAKPDKNEGTLDELRNQGKISGFDYAWGQGMKKKDDK